MNANEVVEIPGLSLGRKHYLTPSEVSGITEEYGKRWVRVGQAEISTYLTVDELLKLFGRKNETGQN